VRKTMGSILKYIGSKNIDLSKYNINDFDTYCEPFGGGFNTGLTLIENGYTGRVIYNDLDEKVVNFWECLKEDSDKLYEKIVKLNNLLQNYFTDEERKSTLRLYERSDNKFKRAASEYLYRQYLTIHGLTFNNKVKTMEKYDIYLASISMGKVEINNTDAKEIIQRIDSDKTFMLIDPPYICDNINNYYRCNSGSFDHKALRDIIYTLKSKCLITYNANDYIRALYKDYNIDESTRIMCGRQYKELYITN
jgi:site-specific DNA-adenine methylase